MWLMGEEGGEEFKNYKAATVQGVGLPGMLYFQKKKKNQFKVDSSQSPMIMEKETGMILWVRIWNGK